MAEISESGPENFDALGIFTSVCVYVCVCSLVSRAVAFLSSVCESFLLAEKF